MGAAGEWPSAGMLLCMGKNCMTTKVHRTIIRKSRVDARKAPMTAPYCTRTKPDSALLTDLYGCFDKLLVLSVGVFILVGGYIRAPDFWKRSHRVNGWEPRLGPRMADGMARSGFRISAWWVARPGFNLRAAG